MTEVLALHNQFSYLFTLISNFFKYFNNEKYRVITAKQGNRGKAKILECFFFIIFIFLSVFSKVRLRFSFSQRTPIKHALKS